MIWVKFKYAENTNGGTGNLIYLPETIPVKKEEITIQFGHKKVRTRVKKVKSSVNILTKSTEQLSFIATKSLLKELCLPISQFYQIKIEEETLHVGPVIGLLLGEQHYYYHHRFMKEYTDALSRMSEFGGLVVAFKTTAIDWSESCIYGLYFHTYKQRWVYAKCPIPTVVFRRAFNHRPEEVRPLINLLGGNMFNGMKLNKWEMHQQLEKFQAFDKYLPETKKLTKEALLNHLERYGKAILKPVDLSRGRGICVIEEKQDGYNIFDTSEDELPIHLHLTKEETFTYVERKNLFKKNYIVQQYLSLSTINGSPWDIRIIMQRNDKKKWQCNGIECRLAGTKEFLTNISRGGRALTVNQAVKLAVGPQANARKIKDELIEAALCFCESMDQTGAHFAEFGLDFALDTNQRYWFIEANVRPTFNGFKKMDYQNYLHMSSAPLLYAAVLAGFKRGKKYERFNTSYSRRYV